jgi:hypothetical protein
LKIISILYLKNLLTANGINDPQMGSHHKASVVDLNRAGKKSHFEQK